MARLTGIHRHVVVRVQPRALRLNDGPAGEPQESLGFGSGFRRVLRGAPERQLKNVATQHADNDGSHGTLPYGNSVCGSLALELERPPAWRRERAAVRRDGC